MPTGARGEGYLELDGKRYELLFTNRALVEAERLTEKSAMRFLRDAKAGDISIGDVAQYVSVGLRYSSRDGGVQGAGLDVNNAWRLLDGIGFETVAAVVLVALAAVMSYQRGDIDSPPA